MKGGESIVNGLQLLFVNDFSIPDLNSQQVNTKNNEFLNFLTSAKNIPGLDKEHMLNDNYIVPLAKEISKMFQLNEEETELIVELLQPFFEQHQIDDLTDPEVIQALTFAITDFLQQQAFLLEEQDSSFNRPSIQSIEQLLRQMIDDLKREAEKNNVHNKIINWQKDQNFRLVRLDSRHLQTTQRKNEYQQLGQQFTKIMQNIDSEADLIQRSPAILKILEQYYQLEQDTSIQNFERLLVNDEKIDTLLQELIDRYTKRMSFVKRATSYNNESKVTSKDVVKWIKHLSPTLMANTSNLHNTEQVVPNILKVQTISTIEQYIIYMQSFDHDPLMGEELLNRFQQVVQMSQLSQAQFTSNQLAISLKPEHLGEMLVRFMEVNGEITVKIFVTSQTAKTALEANIHQLKHMFAPHQVSIEKVDEQDILSKDDALQKEDHPDEQAEEQAREQEKPLPEEEESIDFHKLLKKFV